MTRAWRPGPGNHWSLKVKEDVGNPETVSLPRPRPSKGAPWTNIQGQVIFNFFGIFYFINQSLMTRAWRPGPGSHWSLKVKEDVGNPETVSLPRPRPSKGAPWTNIQGQVIFNFWNILFHQSKSHDKSLTAWAGQPLVPQGQGGCGQPRNSQLAPAQAVKRCAMNQYPRTSNIQFLEYFISSIKVSWQEPDGLGRAATGPSRSRRMWATQKQSACPGPGRQKVRHEPISKDK